MCANASSARSPDDARPERLDDPPLARGTEAGAWFAGDPAFGGVLIVPGTNDLLFLQPAKWDKYEAERAAADPTRRAMATEAGIVGLLENEPNTIVALGG